MGNFISSPDPSIPPADGRCLLLQLPGEVLNEIYRYALTADGKVDLCGTLLKNPWNKKLPQLNVLKQVCRQLRYETKGLELKYNQDLRFQQLETLLFEEKAKDRFVICADVRWHTIHTTFAYRNEKLQDMMNHYRWGFTLTSFVRTLSGLQFYAIQRVHISVRRPCLHSGFNYFAHPRGRTDEPLLIEDWDWLASVLTAHDEHPQENHLLVHFCRAYSSASVQLLEHVFDLPDQTILLHPSTRANSTCRIDRLCIHLLHVQAVLPTNGNANRLGTLALKERAMVLRNTMTLGRLHVHHSRLPNLRYLPSSHVFHEDSMRAALIRTSRENGWQFGGNWSLDQVEERLQWLKAVFESGI